MAEPFTVARPYAEAVFALATETNSLPVWSEMLRSASAVAADPRVGGKILKKIWPPLGTKDFGPFIPTMKQDADAVFSLLEVPALGDSARATLIAEGVGRTAWRRHRRGRNLRGFVRSAPCALAALECNPPR